MKITHIAAAIALAALSATSAFAGGTASHEKMMMKCEKMAPAKAAKNKMCMAMKHGAMMGHDAMGAAPGPDQTGHDAMDHGGKM